MTLFEKLAGKASALLNASDICSNNCIDGHCSGCGECCADLLPLTKGEIKRLPDPDEKVLVRLSHWRGVNIYLAFYDMERGWCDCGGYFDDETNNNGEPLAYETVGVNVTYWMSLPKLPEEEGYYV